MQLYGEFMSNEAQPILVIATQLVTSLVVSSTLPLSHVAQAETDAYVRQPVADAVSHALLISA